LLRLINDRYTGVVKKPCSWYVSYCSLLPKKKKAWLIKDFRPIAVSSVIQRLYDRMLLMKIYQYCEEFDLNQHANRKGWQGTEAIHTLRRVVEKTNLIGASLSICKLDIEKAFDRLCHTIILDMMLARKFPEQLIRAVLVEYVNTSLALHIDHAHMGSVRLFRGVKQGSPISALIFQLVCDDCQRQTLKKWKAQRHCGVVMTWMDTVDAQPEYN